IERDVAGSYRHHSDEKCAGNRLLRPVRFFRGVSQHVPAAERKQTCAYCQRKISHRDALQRRSRRCRTSWCPQNEDQNQKRSDGCDLGNSEDRLQPTAWFYSEIVDYGKQQDNRDRDKTSSIFTKWHKVSDISRADDRDGGNDSGVHAPEHGPTPKEADGR